MWIVQYFYLIPLRATTIILESLALPTIVDVNSNIREGINYTRRQKFGYHYDDHKQEVVAISIRNDKW